MIFLHFHIGNDGFALAANRIVEIVPLVELKATRGAPVGLAGSFAYRDRFIPVADLCAIELGRPARTRLSTRIVVMRHPYDETALFGVIAERATEMLTLDPAAFAPFASGPHGLIQRAEIANLLPAPLLSCMLGERLSG